MGLGRGCVQGLWAGRWVSFCASGDAETSALPLNKPSAGGTSEGIPKGWGPGWGKWRRAGVLWESTAMAGGLGAGSVAKVRRVQNTEGTVMASVEMGEVGGWGHRLIWGKLVVSVSAGTCPASLLSTKGGGSRVSCRKVARTGPSQGARACGALGVLRSCDEPAEQP